MHIRICLILFFFLGMQRIAAAQENNAGWFSLGVRNTISVFSHDGAGLGTGGQFRIQLSNQVNTEWFADYIVISGDDIRSEYLHIGWSVLFYPLEQLSHSGDLLQPFILAGHCFDYNKKTVWKNPDETRDRWGSAVQAGIGTHIRLSGKFDVTVMSQYMIHLTKGLEADVSGGSYTIREDAGNALEGHLLVTLGLNCKLFKLWKKQ